LGTQENDAITVLVNQRTRVEIFQNMLVTKLKFLLCKEKLPNWKEIFQQLKTKFAESATNKVMTSISKQIEDVIRLRNYRVGTLRTVK
jgi:uncharacterized pyridoxamine 5'-phosphate oxidase family protein